MARHELHHPVTEESVREFVDNTAASDATDADKDQQVQALLQGAAANRAWRDSRDAEQRLALASEPFAVVDTEADDEHAAEADDATAVDEGVTTNANS